MYFLTRNISWAIIISRGTVWVLKVKATVVKGIFDSSGPDWNLCTCDETSSRRSASELFEAEAME